MDNCIFCEIIKGGLPSSKVYEDDTLLAFMDIQPVNKGHVLIIPKQHTELITDLEDTILERMMVLAKKVDQALRKSDIQPEGVNLFLADGEAAGQEIFHAHLHVFPRFKKDGFGFTFPSNYTNKPSRDELEIISQKIQLHLR